MYGMKACFKTMIIAAALPFLLSSCTRMAEKHLPKGIPESMRTYLSISDCPACEALKASWKPSDNTGSILLGVRHLTLGSTFFVNIDHERDIIKIKPVRDQHEVILFYDPFHNGSMGYETNSHYSQVRCTCGGFRFQLAVGFEYDLSDDNVTKFVLGGRCTRCGKSRIIYIH